MAYVFDPQALAECARVGQDLPVSDRLEAVHRAVAERYPSEVDTRPLVWMFNNAGGAMGQMALLHASLSEYVLLFGSPIGTEGHSGRYRTEVWDFMLEGEMWCYTEGQAERSVYRPGDTAYLGADKAKGYRIPDHAFILEYSRGPIPTMLPFGLLDTAMSTLDTTTALRTLRAYGGGVVRSLLRGKI